MFTLANPIALRATVKKWPGVQRMINLKVALEDWWFDFYHHVETSTQFEEQATRGWPADQLNFHYLPIRPKCARRVFSNLPLTEPAEYAFIDFGSGKGRMLLMAARHGFRRVYGIEMRKELHDQAVNNLRECRHLQAEFIQCLHMNAAGYDFPDGKLVLFFFNPFGSDVMAKVLANLNRSLDRRFRDVWVVLHDSTSAHLVDRTPRLRLKAARDGYRIYRSTPNPSGA